MNYVSVMTIVAFSLERYLVICHPLYANKVTGAGRTIGIVAVIWLVAFVSAIPFGVYTSVAHLPYPKEAGAHLEGQPITESALCAMHDQNQPEDFPLFELVFSIYFILPMIFL